MSAISTLGTPGTPAASFDACARYSVVHETRYTYQSAVSLSQQYVHLTPRSFAYQHTDSHEGNHHRTLGQRHGRDGLAGCGRVSVGSPRAV